MKIQNFISVIEEERQKKKDEFDNSVMDSSKNNYDKVERKKSP